MSAVTRLAPVLALFLLGQTESTENMIVGKTEWWEDTLIYQIWPRAFQDSDGDGNGDLKGILQRLDYLQDLGVETIFLNPIYSSPMIASGYDISNYTGIHPIFGDMKDFNRLVDKAHHQGMKIILDIVPNHSSNEHTWFYGSINRIDPYTDYYVWADGKVDANGTRLPPNNLASVMSYEDGSAWTWNDTRGQWYYHTYLDSQPDLNLRNQHVIQEILEIINFWLERNVDGFLISDVHYLFEKPSLDDKVDASDGLTDSFRSSETSKLLYQIREYINNWTDVNNSTSKLVMAEAWAPDEDLLSYYGSEGRHPAHGVVPLNFRLIGGIEEGVTAGDIKFLIEGWLEMLPENSTTNWPLSTHKHPRITTRVGDSKFPVYLILSMLLPGQAYTYYGDEIGMRDSKMPWNDTQDSISRILSPNSLVEYSRNAPRTPMQWNETTSAGFSTNDTTYLPVNEDYDYRNVEKQFEDPESTLNMYKSLARLRKEPVFRNGDWQIDTLNDDKILVIERSLDAYPTYIILINTGNERESVNISSLYPDLPGHYLNMVLSTGDSFNKSTVANDRIKLLPEAAMVLKTPEDNETLVEPFIDESSIEHDWIQWMEPHEAALEDLDNSPFAGNLSAEIEVAPCPLNNSEAIQEKSPTAKFILSVPSDGVETSTFQAPRSMNNEADGYAGTSSAYSSKMVKSLLGFFCTIILIFDYIL